MVTERIRRGIYILPSLLTTGNLSAGFISVLLSIHSEFTMAAWCIILAILFDMLDGRVARWTNSTSNFGIELDSLADLVSFGVAPAVLMYQMVLYTMHKPGMAISLFYVIAGAIRLARFNAKANSGESSTDFVGLPIPAGAGILASFVLSYQLFADGQPAGSASEGAGLLLVTAAAVYAQILLGAMVRHTGAGLVCTDLPLCRNALWPTGVHPAVHLHMVHRTFAFVAFGLVLFAG